MHMKSRLKLQQCLDNCGTFSVMCSLPDAWLHDTTLIMGVTRLPWMDSKATMMSIIISVSWGILVSKVIRRRTWCHCDGKRSITAELARLEGENKIRVGYPRMPYPLYEYKHWPFTSFMLTADIIVTKAIIASNFISGNHVLEHLHTCHVVTHWYKLLYNNEWTCVTSTFMVLYTLP